MDAYGEDECGLEAVFYRVCTLYAICPLATQSKYDYAFQSQFMIIFKIIKKRFKIDLSNVEDLSRAMYRVPAAVSGACTLPR